MRFAVEDSSDDDDVRSLDYSISSDDSVAGSPSRNPRSSLGRNILAAYDSSDADSDFASEDEVEALGLGDEWDVVKERAREKPSWRDTKEKLSSGKAGAGVNADASSKEKGKAKMTTPLIPWNGLTFSSSASASRSKRSGLSNSVRAEELQVEEPSEYDRWIKKSDQQVWREGQKQAQERRGELRVIASNARARVRSAEDQRLAKEAEDLRMMLEGMAIKHDHEEEEIARRFAEREKKLWADIDAAIKEVEKKEAELVAAAQAAARRKKADEEARAIAAQRVAEAQKAETEKRAREQAEAEQKNREIAEAEQKRQAALKEEEEVRERQDAKKDRARSEWGTWVEKQRWMKKEVIEIVKADRAMKTGLRPGMRLMTRGLGQVVNTQETVTRVTNDIHNILSQQLPSPPSPSSPTSLNEATPKAYAYLLSHLSKALIKQAESEVNAKPDAAFPLARIIVGLLLRGHAALGEVLFARFVKKCPWAIPYYPKRQPNQPREEFEKSTGRGSDESVADYISRMAGICTLYFAVLQTPIASLIPTISAPPPGKAELEILIQPIWRFPSSWTWLSLALKDPMPGLPPTAHLVSAWIEIIAHEAVRVFGRGQMGKVWDAIEGEGLAGGLIKGDSEAARQRLGSLLEKLRKGQVEVPQGRVWE
ncbi:hypothetical protein I316_07574 [Kwoniella heveanensis BCC8398]|uniref:mRNA export factor GLE1 n=1 Tax=Kwoniella heveanensis BCC8398 TaxID=1296120 RepID=A0A1B9GIG2_9TREE|nr:hypothetical protein I316_07574 [Kwoniella heveanensis BCC8398]